MKFKNNGEDTKVRLAEGTGFRWMTARKNEIVELDEQVGLINGFEKVEVEKPKEVKPEVKPKVKPQKSRKK